MNRTAGHASQAPSSRWGAPFRSTASTASLARPSSSSQAGLSQAGLRSSSSHIQASTPRSAANVSLGPITRPKSREDFSVAIFCALPIEADAVDAFFIHHWDERIYGKAPGDMNSYTLGCIGKCNVVLVHLAGMGKGMAAIAAASCHRSFLGVQLALVVGICGGVPATVTGGTERVLGDVVISNGLVQYDFGRQYPGHFERKTSAQDNLRGLSHDLRRLLAKLEGRRVHHELQESTWEHLCTLQNDRDFRKIATYPGAQRDILYESSYIHRHREPRMCRDWDRTCGTPNGSCEQARSSQCDALQCGHQRVVPRRRLVESLKGSAPDHHKPMIHFGALASGDGVMKSGEDRDRIAQAEQIIAFEMEGAGVWEVLPCLVMKGICDYADSHKSKAWQNYAAATAAACMAAFLDEWASNR